MTEQVLIVDDDTRLSAMLADYLAGNGFDVRTAETAAEGLSDLQRRAPDAVILDIMLPDVDGFEACRRIRAVSDVPVLMLTAKGEETDRIVGLELGADDYLPKPFNPRELLARLKAILRRRHGGGTGAERVLRFGRLEIDPGSRAVRLDGTESRLTSHQFDLLLTLARNAGRTLSRDQLMDMTRGEELEAFDRSIDVHVSRIRAAIEADPKHPRRLITVRGAGYVFARYQDDI
ncbi:response regulator [Nitratireductor sp. CAU 1489]|uniref:Regulatory protein VirG n=1 Tax=Nitratireductor arenosus TaxID=2682096 RepID=A0A844QB32_9HYPH|nr:response regulator [Nitratireductor arenosus]MVA96412.1 response regulator [Nitratireductor arenosus]